MPPKSREGKKVKVIRITYDGEEIAMFSTKEIKKAIVEEMEKVTLVIKEFAYKGHIVELTDEKIKSIAEAVEKRLLK